MVEDRPTKQLWFKKRVNPGELHRELKEAGFDIAGILFTEPDEVRVVLHLEETRDPASIVWKHVYSPAVLQPRRDLAKELDELKAKLKTSGIEV